jgi:hypothetical protein
MFRNNIIGTIAVISSGMPVIKDFRLLYLIYRGLNRFIYNFLKFIIHNITNHAKYSRLRFAAHAYLGCCNEIISNKNSFFSGMYGMSMTNCGNVLHSSV